MRLFHLIKPFSPLRNPTYRKIWFGALVSNIGTWIQKVAQPWMVLSLTGSSFLLGLDGFMQDFPLFLLLLFGGAVVDRYSKIKILLFAQFAQFIATLTLTILALLGLLEVWMIMTISFIMGAVQAFSVPAYISILSHTVRKKDIGAAIALNSTQFSLTRFIGPAIGGVLLASYGPVFCFALNSLTFLSMYFVFKSLPYIEEPNSNSTIPQIIQSLPDIITDIHTALKKIFHEKEFLIIVASVFWISFCAGSLVVFIPVVCTSIYHTSPIHFSIALAVFGIGSIIGSIRVASQSIEEKSDLNIIIVGLGISLITYLLVLFSNFYILLVLMFLVGVFFVTSNATGNSILQSKINNDLRGRIASIYSLAYRGGLPFGSLFIGIISDRYSIQTALIINAIILGICLLMLLLLRVYFLRKKRHLS